MESMLAVIALIAVASFATGEAAKQGLVTQPQIFAGAIANFLSVAGLPHQLVFTLINLAVSAFALTSLDSVARVGRLSFQEFFIDDDTDMDNLNPFMKVLYDGSNIYSTWHDNLQIIWSVIYNRINIWYDITVNLCSIVIMSWCNRSNPGCKKAF